MSCPGKVESAFSCSGAVHEYFDEEGNSREVYAHRGLIQEEEADFDPEQAFYNFLKTLRFVKYIEVDPTRRSYIVWVHEDTKLTTYQIDGVGWSHKRTSVYALGFRPPQDLQYNEYGVVPYDERRVRDGRIFATNKNNTDPVPAEHICEVFVHEAYSKHKGISSIREATCGYYKITIGPEPGDEYYYPIPADVILRTYIIKF